MKKKNFILANGVFLLLFPIYIWQVLIAIYEGQFSFSLFYKDSSLIIINTLCIVWIILNLILNKLYKKKIKTTFYTLLVIMSILQFLTLLAGIWYLLIAMVGR